MLTKKFFNRDAAIVAQQLLGKIIRHKVNGQWLQAQIIETEAYYLQDKASHASLGYTHKRRALFMPPGTIYMYYARGGDSFNMSCLGEGNAVLVKSAIVYNPDNDKKMIVAMQRNNPVKGSGRIRKPENLCKGQTLLCRALNLKVPVWDAQMLQPNLLEINNVGIKVKQIIKCPRLGIPAGRDEDLLLRFIDGKFINQCTKKP